MTTGRSPITSRICRYASTCSSSEGCALLQRHLRIGETAYIGDDLNSAAVRGDRAQTGIRKLGPGFMLERESLVLKAALHLRVRRGDDFTGKPIDEQPL